MPNPGSLKMAVFLGNPGSRYRRTRHNAAWMVLEHEPFRAIPWQTKFNGSWAKWGPTVLLKPETHMNRSGESVQAACRFFRIDPTEVVVVHDEVELRFGHVSVRQGGGLAGHNGLRSVSTHLSTREFWRYRIGIGRPARGELHNHVLGRFTVDEESELASLLPSAAAELAALLQTENSRGR